MGVLLIVFGVLLMLKGVFNDKLQIDNLITEGMSYEKAIATLERINELQNKFNKK